MAKYQYRELKPTAEAEDVYRRWLAHLDEEFTRHKESRLRSEIVRDSLHQIYLGARTEASSTPRSCPSYPATSCSFRSTRAM